MKKEISFKPTVYPFSYKTRDLAQQDNLQLESAASPSFA